MNELIVVILTYNEEIHIKRCIQSVKPIASCVFVVDSYSSDRTMEIAQSLDAIVVQRTFINQAEQFNWALNNLPLNVDWVMRLDADEYLDVNSEKELFTNKLMKADGIFIKRKIIFQGKWIRYGGVYPQVVLRIWRNGKGRVEQRWMDEHTVLAPHAVSIVSNIEIVDDNKKGITFWIDKHNRYASREAIDILNLKYALLPRDSSLLQSDDPQAKQKRYLKENIYSRLPLGARSAMYFFYRYIFRLGILDGSKGFVYHYLQAFWYRFLVDIKIKDLEEQGHHNIDEIKTLLREQHGIDLS